MPPAVANVGGAPLAAVVAANLPAEKPVDLPANTPLVVKTAFLGYDDAPAVGGVPQKRLSNSQMLRAFGRRCKLAPAPGFAPASPPGVLQLALSTQGWTKVLQELVASGLLQAAFEDLGGLDSAIDSLTIVNPANLILALADLDLGEDTLAIAATAGTPAVAAVGRRGRAGHVAAQPAVAANPGRPALDPALEFLSATHVTVAYLEIEGVAPWANVAYLCGALGSYLTQSARNGMGPARLTASTLAMGMNKAFGISLADNLSLAGELPGFLSVLRTRMPVPMRCASVDLAELRIEFRDTVLYGLSKEDRIRVETQRVHLIGDRYAHTARTRALSASAPNGFEPR